MRTTELRLAKVVFRLVCGVVLALAIVQVAWMNPAKSSDSVTVVSEMSAGTGRVDETASLAAELENKRAVLEAKARELDEKEHRLSEREKELDKKLKEMERLRAEVSGELEKQRQNNEERVLKMVAVFESMSPKAASGVMETLDDWLAVETMKRMETKRVAKIMNLMDKNRSAKLSELLTGYFNPSRNPAGQVPGLRAQAAPGEVATNPNGKEVKDE